MNIKKEVIEILKKEVKPAVGCTEPVAVALNTAHAVDLLPADSKEISKITVELSKGIYKNGMDVGIPNTKKIGLDVAASLGAATSPTYGLEILGKIKAEELKKSEKASELYEVDIKVAKDNNKSIYVKTTIENSNHTSIAVTEDKHDNLVYLSLDGKEILNKRNEASNQAAISDSSDADFYSLPIDTIVKEIEEIDYDDIKFLLDGIEMNMQAAKAGIEANYGLGVGYNFHKNIEKGIISKDFANWAYMLTAAASDARMSGQPIPVMSSSGSGNNGLTAILPLAAYKEILDVSDENLTKAVAISHIITSYVKKYIGRLSNLCGCSLAASIGSGSAIAWLLSGRDYITPTINNVIANQAGVICDGAKPGCALKLGTAAATAVQSALLAIEGTIIKDHNGIASRSAEDSIRNLGIISSDGMKPVDDAVIRVMLNREI